MSKSIADKYKEILEEGPDSLPIDIRLENTRVPVKSKNDLNMKFVTRGKSNKLGKTSDYAREALTLDADDPLS